MGKTTKISRQAQLQAILAGIAKRYPNGTTIPLGGATWAIADLVKLIQQDLDGIRASALAKAAYAAQVQLERTTRAKLGPTLRQLKRYVLATLGDTQDAVQALGDFGFAPPRSNRPTAATKAEAQGKAKATRTARGTKGPKAKAKIKGTVPSNGAGASGLATAKA